MDKAAVDLASHETSDANVSDFGKEGSGPELPLKGVGGHPIKAKEALNDRRGVSSTYQAEKAKD